MAYRVVAQSKEFTWRWPIDLTSTKISEQLVEWYNYCSARGEFKGRTYKQISDLILTPFKILLEHELTPSSKMQVFKLKVEGRYSTDNGYVLYIWNYHPGSKIPVVLNKTFYEGENSSLLGEYQCETQITTHDMGNGRAIRIAAVNSIRRPLQQFINHPLFESITLTFQGLGKDRFTIEVKRADVIDITLESLISRNSQDLTEVAHCSEFLNTLDTVATDIEKNTPKVLKNDKRIKDALEQIEILRKKVAKRFVELPVFERIVGNSGKRILSDHLDKDNSNNKRVRSE